MSDFENKNDSPIPEEPESGRPDGTGSGSAEFFGGEGFTDTRRISPEEMERIESGIYRAEESFDDIDEIEERDYRPVRQRRDRRIGCLGGLMFAVFVISVSVILACFGWMCSRDVLALGKETVTATVSLPESIFEETEMDVKDKSGNITGTKTVLVADMDYVTDQLKNGGLIEYKWLFKLYSKISHASQKLSPGAYELSTNLDYRALVKSMTSSSSSRVIVTVTFPEGYTMAQIFAKLEENGVCSAEALYEAAADYDYDFSFLEGSELGDASRLEGFIFPNTYDFYVGEQASSVINKFLTALHYNITAEMRNQCQGLGISFRDAVNIASMIEKEAANDEERPIIASVIYNRLAAGMTLGVDSTVLYEFQDFTGGEITSEMINFDSPYNTRIYPGLPPTPICNPGMASIKAALNPSATGYYYYALDESTGVHRFFTNSRDFEAFTATQSYASQA